MSKSFVEIGTSFEFLTLKLLQSYGFRLSHFGGGNDMGIDLRGSWHLPQGTQVSSIVQCKYESKTCTSRYIRELHGTIFGTGGSTKTLAVIAHNIGFSSASRMAINTSQVPILACVINEVNSKGVLVMAAMNNLAHQLLPSVIISNQRQLGTPALNASSILYKMPNDTYVDIKQP